MFAASSPTESRQCPAKAELQDTCGVEASHSVDKPSDGRAAAGPCPEGRQVGAALWHEVIVLCFVYQVSGIRGKMLGQEVSSQCGLHLQLQAWPPTSKCRGNLGREAF